MPKYTNILPSKVLDSTQVDETRSTLATMSDADFSTWLAGLKSKFVGDKSLLELKEPINTTYFPSSDVSASYADILSKDDYELLCSIQAKRAPYNVGYFTRDEAKFVTTHEKAFTTDTSKFPILGSSMHNRNYI